MKPIHEPRLTEFSGWQNDMEYLADEEECKRRTQWQIDQYQKQMREQRPGMFLTGKHCLLFFGQVVLLGAFLVLASYGFVIVAELVAEWLR